MLRYVSSYRSHLLGLSLLALLALIILLFIQAPSPAGPAIQPRPVSNEAASGAIVDPLAGIHPADRKFYNGWYAPSAGISNEAVVPANVHPADRKFFYGGLYAPQTGTSAEAVIPAGVHPADRKFFVKEYMEIVRR